MATDVGFVQRAVGSPAFGTTATVAINPAAGNTLVLIVYRDNNNSGPVVSSVTDSKGQTWTNATQPRSATPPVADYSAGDTTVALISTAYIFNVAAGATTITATVGSADWLMLEVYELSAVGSVQGGAIAHPAAGTSAAASLVTTGTVFMLAFGGVRASDVATAQAGYTQSAVCNVDSTAYGRSAYKAAVAAGTQAVTWTWTGTKNMATGLMAFAPVPDPVAAGPGSDQYGMFRMFGL